MTGFCPFSALPDPLWLLPTSSSSVFLFPFEQNYLFFFHLTSQGVFALKEFCFSDKIASLSHAYPPVFLDFNVTALRAAFCTPHQHALVCSLCPGLPTWSDSRISRLCVCVSVCIYVCVRVRAPTCSTPVVVLFSLSFVLKEKFGAPVFFLFDSTRSEEVCSFQFPSGIHLLGGKGVLWFSKLRRATDWALINTCRTEWAVGVFSPHFTPSVSFHSYHSSESTPPGNR